LDRKDTTPLKKREQLKKGQRPEDSIVSEKLHQTIENIQVIILSAELLKEEIGGGDARIAIQDMINQIINRAMDNTVLISDIRKILGESSKIA
jgi:hypothetical protein